MELRMLRYFLKVCEIENITRAAAELNTTQPNLSRQLYQLEEDLGNSNAKNKSSGRERIHRSRRLT